MTKSFTLGSEFRTTAAPETRGIASLGSLACDPSVFWVLS